MLPTINEDEQQAALEDSRSPQHIAMDEDDANEGKMPFDLDIEAPQPQACNHNLESFAPPKILIGPIECNISLHETSKKAILAKKMPKSKDDISGLKSELKCNDKDASTVSSSCSHTISSSHSDDREETSDTPFCDGCKICLFCLPLVIFVIGIFAVMKFHEVGL